MSNYSHSNIVVGVFFDFKYLENKELKTYILGKEKTSTVNRGLFHECYANTNPWRDSYSIALPEFLFNLFGDMHA